MKIFPTSFPEVFFCHLFQLYIHIPPLVILDNEVTWSPSPSRHGTSPYAGDPGAALQHHEAFVTHDNMLQYVTRDNMLYVTSDTYP